MRQKVLYRSVAALLDQGERVRHLAYLSRAQGWLFPLIAAVALLGFLVAWVIGVEAWVSRLVVGLAFATVVMIAKVDYRVLVATDTGVVMMQAARLRQVATSVLGPVPPGTAIELTSNNLFVTQWQIGDDQYTVMKRFQSDMIAIAQGQTGGSLGHGSVGDGSVGDGARGDGGCGDDGRGDGSFGDDSATES